jgi:crotonobetainyl-CoA:carnitine CoA-transferase CaiB-like acyl-CoA transferase
MKYARSATTFGSTRPVQIRCTPLLGQHTREVLTEVGYTEAEIDALYDKSIALTEKPSS